MKREIRQRRGTMKSIADANNDNVKNVRARVQEYGRPLRGEMLNITGNSIGDSLDVFLRFAAPLGELFKNSPVKEILDIARGQLGNKFNGSLLNACVALYRVGIRRKSDLIDLVSDPSQISSVAQRATWLVAGREIIGQAKQLDIISVEEMRDGFTAILGFLNQVASETHAQNFALTWIFTAKGYQIKFVTDDMIRDALEYFDARLLDGKLKFDLDEWAATFRAAKLSEETEITERDTEAA